MKKRLGVLAAALTVAATATPAFAQGIDMGIRAGMNMARFGGDDVQLGTVDPSRRTGLTMGGFVSFGIAPFLSIQPELLFSQKGSRYEASGGEVAYELDYVDVPVLAVLSTPLQSVTRIRPFLVVGPVASFRAGCNMHAEADAVSVDVDCDDPDADVTEFKNVDFGLVLGGGAGIGMGPGTLSLDARYGLGFGTIDDSTTEADIKNQVISISLGYALHLGL